MCGEQVWRSWNIYFSSEASEKGFFRFEAARDNQLLSRHGEQEGKSLRVMTSLRASVCLSVLRPKARLRELASISMQSFLNLPSLLSDCVFESCYLFDLLFLLCKNGKYLQELDSSNPQLLTSYRVSSVCSRPSRKIQPSFSGFISCCQSI